MYTWGCNDEGALGRAVKEGEEFSPGCVQGLDDMMVVQLSAGDSHTAALTSSGEVYCWGVFRVSLSFYWMQGVGGCVYIIYVYVCMYVCNTYLT